MTKMDKIQEAVKNTQPIIRQEPVWNSIMWKNVVMKKK